MPGHNFVMHVFARDFTRDATCKIDPVTQQANPLQTVFNI